MTNNSINTSIPIEVTKGGTQSSSFVAFAPIVGGVTSTGALQSVASAGNAGEFLVSQGPSALPIWQAGGGGGGFSNINIQTFSATGTYTPSANLVQAIVILTAGGGGGGSVNGLVTTRRGGGGGAAGETRIGSFSAAQLASAAPITVTIGAGGGNNAFGAASSFGSLMTSNPGGPGAAISGNTSPAIATGGNVGSGGSGGQISIPFSNGHNEYAYSLGVCGGNGGNSYWASGGPGGFSEQNGTLATNGSPGLLGAGGGGGAAYSTSTSAVGGAGGSGYCVVYEYIG